MEQNRISAYWQEHVRFRATGAPAASLLDLARFYGDWKKFLAPGATAIDARIPWMTFGAIDFLKKNLLSTHTVFEYGCGGSTIFFAERAGHVTSVEHDPGWASKAQQALPAQLASKAKILSRPPEPAGSAGNPASLDDYASSDDLFKTATFKAYAAAIDESPDGFDFISLDGRARPSCFKHARHKVKPGGWILLDNAEREHYSAIHSELDRSGWRRKDFGGPGPFNRYFWLTVAWQRPA